MLRWLPLILVLLAAPAWAAGEIDQEMRRVEAALSRISQEQQSVYQQFQMVQEMRRSDERQMQPLQSYTPPPTPPNYDDVKREEEARVQRIKDVPVRARPAVRTLSRARGAEEAAAGRALSTGAAAQPAAVDARFLGGSGFLMPYPSGQRARWTG